ncbi:hypothetical protein QUB37_25360 [Microcoleus sp. AT3-A2]|uniref:hypothetical protein n=1 Tax=unclassified Microcoleus TaxID=2642155 RepID=UPI002FD39FBF
MTVHFTYFERTPSKSQIIAEDAFAKELFFDVPGKTGVRARVCRTFAVEHSRKTIARMLSIY